MRFPVLRGASTISLTAPLALPQSSFSLFAMAFRPRFGWASCSERDCGTRGVVYTALQTVYHSVNSVVVSVISRCVFKSRRGHRWIRAKHSWK
uniref:Putative secreted peptide n=1 Tax=Anopheles braziliensis TaxID=58242 RepID=A0A2M3ZWE5_9DIPT